jgi:hypothetical protein
MNHMVIEIKETNEASALKFPIIGNYMSYSHFKNCIAQDFKILETQKSEITFQYDSCVEGC